MTDRTWELLMMMVHAGCQGRGIGSRLLRAVEDELRLQAVGCS
ncbi:GNAT family N-acetyltransferase [Aquisphaera insulae]